MAYQINYYTDRAMRRPGIETDNIGDAALLRYPAPKGNEVAYARHNNNPDLNAYGYDGQWHDRPPTETIEADKREEKEAQERRKAEEYAAQPHITGVMAHDRTLFVVKMPSPRSASRRGVAQTSYIRLEELRAAARQDDPEARRVYGQLLVEAEEFLRRDNP